ncbi:MAG: biopolymer transporter ExbD [Acidobacteriota bacterium]
MRQSLDPRRPSAEIPTSSLADVAFLLLVFFVLTAAFASDRGLDFGLDHDEQPDRPVEFEESVLVEVLPDASLRVDGRAMALDGLLSYLHPKLSHNPRKPVLLVPDREAPYGAMVTVYDTLRLGRKHLGLDEDIRVVLPTEREIAAFG